MRTLLWSVTLASLWLWTVGAVPAEGSIVRRHQHPHGVHAKRSNGDGDSDSDSPSPSPSDSDFVVTPERPDQGRSNECGRRCCSGFFQNSNTYWTMPVADFEVLFQCFQHCEDTFHYPPEVGPAYVKEVRFAIDTSVRACIKEGKKSRKKCRKQYSKGGLAPNPRSWYFEVSPVLDARPRLATLATEVSADLARLAHTVQQAVPRGVRTMMMRAGRPLQLLQHRSPLVRPKSWSGTPATAVEGVERAMRLREGGL
ncbi:MAG: hypothetical protein M1826_005791 [Phylliscum demangeonii]|nr:MAG: hypothetical protein M1826_005791 [Phylliscum demangeonii]